MARNTCPAALRMVSLALLVGLLLVAALGIAQVRAAHDVSR
jgi:hypothetical protein